MPRPLLLLQKNSKHSVLTPCVSPKSRLPAVTPGSIIAGDVAWLILHSFRRLVTPEWLSHAAQLGPPVPGADGSATACSNPQLWPVMQWPFQVWWRRAQLHQHTTGTHMTITHVCRLSANSSRIKWKKPTSVLLSFAPAKTRCYWKNRPSWCHKGHRSLFPA